MVADRKLAALRVDHVGSLLRPDPLKAVVAQLERGDTTEAEVRQAQDAAIRDVIAQQEALGFPIVTDGEFRRMNFQDSFAASVSGLAGGAQAMITRQPVRARLQMVRNQPLDEFRFSQPI